MRSPEDRGTAGEGRRMAAEEGEEEERGGNLRRTSMLEGTRGE